MPGAGGEGKGELLINRYKFQLCKVNKFRNLYDMPMENNIVLYIKKMLRGWILSVLTTVK